ncbi:MAG TPA: NAD(P)H-dependent oxidoreductase subunit E [Solirubrobacteraceae bacterium]|jgi:NADH:ubiquinone oxidoreductase subunit E|nr:NAD(P)H-dependent oxidoreductase subunit E [Solirubrobacteraceae bacterium]
MIGRRKRAADPEAVAAAAAETAAAVATRELRGGPGPAQRSVTRFGHGSRVPGWDDAANLTKDPAEIPDPATTPVDARLRAEIEAHMAKYPDFRSAAIPALAAAQRFHGWCSPEAIEQAACVMRLTPGYLISVASFYDMLETRPVGRHRVYVCTNISCSLCGANELMAALLAQTEGDPDFNVRSFECLGACDIAPMASVNDVYVGPIELDDVPKLVEQIRAGVPPLPNKQLHLRKSTDPGAVALPAKPTPMPDQPPISHGPSMGGEVTGPPAAIERPPKEDA